MKQFAGIAALAIAAHTGLALAQPVIIERGDLEPGGGERSMQRGAPMRAPAEAERDRPQRVEPPSRERRDVQSAPSRGQDMERPQAKQREQVPRERAAEPSPSRAPQDQRGQTPDRSQAQRDQPDSRNGGRTNERGQQNERPSSTPEMARPQQPDQRTAPSTARPAPTEPNRSDSATQSQGASPQNPAGTQPRDDKSEQRSQASSQSRSEADQQRIVESVRDRVDRNEMKPVRDFGISVTVGAQLPSRVALQPLPREIATLRPQFRGYRYTVSESQIVIVDPGSRRVVEVIDRNSGRAGGVSYYAAFEHQRDVKRWRRPGSVAFQTGVVLPGGIPLHDLPVEIVERNPAWRDYQYVMTETDEIAVVEPRTHRIVQVIDKDAPQAASVTTSGTGGASVSGSPGDRRDLARIILQDAKPGEIQGIEGLKGAVLPSEVNLRPLPAEVEQRDPQLRGYQYTLIGDDVLIIDPQSRRIIDVIE